MMSTIKLEVERSPAEKTLEPLRSALRAYNESRVGSYAASRIGLLAHADDGEFLGGGYGWLQWGWLYVEWLFVAESSRRDGLGGRMLAALEGFARDEGVTRARLNTGSFQGALPFYLRHGYTVYAELPITAPDGAEHVDYSLRKSL